MHIRASFYVHVKQINCTHLTTDPYHLFNITKLKAHFCLFDLQTGYTPGCIIKISAVQRLSDKLEFILNLPPLAGKLYDYGFIFFGIMGKYMKGED